MPEYASQCSKPDCENNFHAFYICHSKIITGNLKLIDQATATVNYMGKIRQGMWLTHS